MVVWIPEDEMTFWRQRGVPRKLEAIRMSIEVATPKAAKDLRCKICALHERVIDTTVSSKWLSIF